MSFEMGDSDFCWEGLQAAGGDGDWEAAMLEFPPLAPEAAALLEASATTQPAKDNRTSSYRGVSKHNRSSRWESHCW